MKRDFESNAYAKQVLAPQSVIASSDSPVTVSDIDTKNCRDGVLLINCETLSAEGGFALATYPKAGAPTENVVWLYGSEDTFEKIPTSYSNKVTAFPLNDMRGYLKLWLHSGGQSAAMGIVLAGWNRVKVPVT